MTQKPIGIYLHRRGSTPSGIFRFESQFFDATVCLCRLGERMPVWRAKWRNGKTSRHGNYSKKRREKSDAIVGENTVAPFSKPNRREASARMLERHFK